MKSTQYDPETNQTYLYEKKYDLKIQKFKESNDFVFFDDEVIEYAISLKNEIITELDNKSSKSDKIRLKHIKWIEKYVDGIHDFLIQEKMSVPQVLENHKPFVSQRGQKIGRPKGYTERTIKRYKKIFQTYIILKKKFSSEKNIRIYELLAAKDYDSKTYSRRTIKNIIEDKKYNLKPSR